MEKWQQHRVLLRGRRESHTGDGRVPEKAQSARDQHGAKGGARPAHPLTTGMGGDTWMNRSGSKSKEEVFFILLCVCLSPHGPVHAPRTGD